MVNITANVLFIDKQVDIYNTLNDRLSSNDIFKYYFIDSSAEIETILENRKFDVIVCDYVFLHDGLMEVIRYFGGVPFIVLSDNQQDGAVDKMREAGIDEFILKDEQRLFIETIPEAVTNILKKKKLKMVMNNTITGSGFSDLIQFLPEIVYKIDSEGRFSFLNKAVRILGYSPDELMGEHFRHIIHPDDFCRISRRHVIRQYKGKTTGTLMAPKLFDERRSASRATNNLSVRMIKRTWYEDPSPVNEIETRITAYGDFENLGSGNERLRRFTGTVGIINNITEDKKLEKILRRFYKAVEQSPVSILIFSRDGIINYANPHFCGLTGFKAGEVLGKHVHCAESASNPYNLKDIVCSRKKWNGVLESKKIDGSIFWESVIIMPITSAVNEVNECLMIRVDISDYKKIEQELCFTLEQLKDSNKARIKFFSHMSHELRTPVSAIIDLSEMLLKYNHLNLSDVQKEHINVIADSGYKALSLIDNILALSRLDTKKITLARGEFEFSWFLSSLKKMLRDVSLEKEESLDLNVDIDASIPEFLAGDGANLVRVFSGIFEAFSYMIKEDSIFFKVVRTGDNLFFEIKNRDRNFSDISLDAEEDIFKLITPDVPAEQKKFILNIAYSRKIVKLLNGEFKSNYCSQSGCYVSFLVPVEFIVNNKEK